MSTLATARPRLTGFALSVLLVLATACGGVTGAEQADGAHAGAANPAATSDPVDGDSSGNDLTITGVDYAFEAIPDVVRAGHSIGFVNASDTEAHELVIFPVAGDESRAVEELWDEIDPATEPLLVAVAGPGEAGQVFVGDGTLTQPGRYLAVCFLPVGADPAQVLQGDGPPESDAPPHAEVGMVAEIIVEA